MKKAVALSTIIAGVLFFTACQNAPDEVKKEKEILDNNSQVEKADIEYLSMDEIRDKSLDTLTHNKTNVTVEKVIIGNGDVMPAYTIQPYNNNFDRLNDIVKYLYDQSFSLESPYCETHKAGEIDVPGDPVTQHDWLMFKGKDLDFTRSLIYHETGYSFYNAVPGEDPYRFTESFPTEKRYKINLGDYLDGKSYIMLDGNEWSVNDAAAFAQAFCDTYFAPLENDRFTYSMTDFRVKKLDEKYGYVIEFQRVDKNGNLFDNHYSYFNYEDFDDIHPESANNWIEKGYPYLYSSAIEITFNNKEIINSFIKCNAPYAGDIVDSGEKLISLESAINVISSKMASRIAYDFETAELEYYYTALDCPGYTYPSNDGAKLYSPEEMLNTANVQIRPYWAFTTSECYHDMQSEDDNTPVISNSLYLVDALTGELYIY